MLRPILRVVAAGSFALVTGCSGDPVTPLPAVEGEYALELVNGMTLPFLKEASASQRVEVVSGSLVLRSNHTYSGTIVEQWTTGSDVQAFPESSAGTYIVSGNHFTFTESGSGAVYHGTLAGTRITATLMDVTFRFVKR